MANGIANRAVLNELSAHLNELKDGKELCGKFMDHQLELANRTMNALLQMLNSCLGKRFEINS